MGVDAVKKYAGVDWNEVETLEQARELAKEHNVEFEERHKKGDILNLFFEEFVEEHLLQPTFVMDHPVEISPLTKKKPENPEYVERFEFFMNGWEMANAYSELNDPIDQRERFKAQEELLAQGDDEANTTDEDFMNALEIGMPPTGGIGFGIDRMCMLLTGAEAIRDVLLFPTMKSLDSDKKENKALKSNTAENCDQIATVEEKIDFSNVKIEPLFEETVDFDTFSKSDFRAVKVKECVAVPKSKKLLQFTLDDGTGTDRTILSGSDESWFVGYNNADATFSGKLLTKSVTKMGTGNWTIKGNENTSSITVKEGKLTIFNISGVATTGTMTVGKGAVLAGTGTTNSIVAQTGAVVKPGMTDDAVATLTTNSNAIMQVGATLVVNVSATSNSKLNVKGSIFSMAGNDTIVIAPQAGRTFIVGEKLTLFPGTKPASGWVIKSTDGSLWDDSTLAADGSIVCTQATTGISAVDVDEDEIVDVLTVDGKVVKNDVKRRNATNGLPHGIYVVGGKVVRK